MSNKKRRKRRVMTTRAIKRNMGFMRMIFVTWRHIAESKRHTITSQSHALDSKDEGPDEDVDEDGPTTKQDEAHNKAVDQGHRPSLFLDLSLVDKAIVDGGISRVLEPRLSSKKGWKTEELWVNRRVKFQRLLEF
jgi:hypothetical protein